MRVLRKHPCPAVLIENFDKWTEEYVAARGQGRDHTGRWGHGEIRTALGAETGGLCAYCESRIAPVAYENVEHMKPKSIFPELAHSWENLTTACPVCNTRKSDYYDSDFSVLNPYQDLPHEHMAFLGGIPYAVGGSARGNVTIDKAGLRRLQLVTERSRRLCDILNLYRVWEEAEGPLKSAAADALVADCVEGEYPTAVRSFLVELGFPIP